MNVWVQRLDFKTFEATIIKVVGAETTQVRICRVERSDTMTYSVSGAHFGPFDFVREDCSWRVINVGAWQGLPGADEHALCCQILDETLKLQAAEVIEGVEGVHSDDPERGKRDIGMVHRCIGWAVSCLSGNDKP